MATAGEKWAFWLETKLEDRGWRAADLVKASGLKENGRPVIDAPRVSAWLKGERPSYDLAVAAGEALGGLPRDALIAAGYPVGIDVATHAEGVVVEIAPAQHGGQRNPVIEAIEADPYLLPEAKAHFLNQYELLLRVGAPESLGYAARPRPGVEVVLDPEQEAEVEAVTRKAVKANRATRRKAGETSPKGK